MSYGGGYGGYGGYGGGGYGQGSGSPGRPRNVGAFAPQETTRPGSFAADPSSMSRGAYGGGYGQNAGPGSARAPPGVGAFSVQDASRPAYAQQPPGGYQPPTGGGFQPAQRRFGDGGYGGVGAGPGLSAPTGRGGDGGYGGLPPRALERSSAFGTGPGDRGATQDAAPRRGFADSPLAQALRRSDEAASAAAPAAGAFSLASATTAGASASSAAGGRRLGASAFVNPQRELVTPQAPHPEGARPTFSLEKFGITGDNAAAHDRAASSAGGTRFSSRAGSGANSPGSASPPGAGGAGDGGAARAQTRRLPLYVGADLPAADPNAAAAASPASNAFAQASALAQRRQAMAAANAALNPDTTNTAVPPEERTQAGATFSAARRAAAVDSAARLAADQRSRAASFRDSKRPLITSATVQSHFHFGSMFSFTFIVISFLILLWKGCRLPYPGVGANRWGLDVAFLVAYAVVDPTRAFLASVANKALRARWMYASVVLAAPLFGVHAYYAWGQTFVLKIDVFLNVCGMGFLGVQTALSLFAVGAFPASSSASTSGFSRSRSSDAANRARLDLNRRGDDRGRGGVARLGGFQVQ